MKKPLPKNEFRKIARCLAQVKTLIPMLEKEAPEDSLEFACRDSLLSARNSLQNALLTYNPGRSLDDLLQELS